MVLALATALASLPMALLFFRVMFPDKTRERSAPVIIPPADAEPAGSFLDVPLPSPPQPWESETGVPARHWKPVDGIVALLLVAMFASQALAGLAAAAAPPSGKLPEAGHPALDLSVQSMSGLIMFQLSVIALTLAYLGYLRGFRISAIFGLRRLSPLKALGVGLAWIVAGGAVLLAIMELLLRLLLQAGFSMPEQQALVRALQTTPDPATAALTVISVVICAPIMEEILFRGLFYGVAKRFTHPTYAAIAVSVFFGAVHGNFLSLLPLTLLGLMFTMAYERTRSLLVPMVMHAVFNGAQMALIFYAKEIQDAAQRASAGG